MEPGVGVLDQFRAAWARCGQPVDVDMVSAAPDEAADSVVVAEGRHLGILTSAVPCLCREAAAVIRRHREAEQRGPDIDHVAAASAAGLLCNGMNYTLWNARKRLLHGGHLPLAEEPDFVDLVMRLHLKRPEVYEHRRFVTRWQLREAGSDAGAALALLRREISAVEQAAHLYPRNYAAWAHRAWVCDQLPPAEAVEETSRLLRWIRMHVSDASACHYLCHALDRVQRDGGGDNTCRAVAAGLLDIVRAYPAFGALWFGLRGVLVVGARSAHASAIRDAVLGAARDHACADSLPSPAERASGSGSGSVDATPPDAALHARRLLQWWERESVLRGPQQGRDEVAANATT